jgi:hypothetical protein
LIILFNCDSKSLIENAVKHPNFPPYLKFKLDSHR